MSEQKSILVTNALPYANGPIHLGHMLEHIQSDIYVRYLRAKGHTVHYVCGDDCHGTPVMIRAMQNHVTPEELIERSKADHEADLKGFLVSYDNYYKTHSDENREICADMYLKAREAGYIVTRKISQLYDPEKQMFLPDRFVKGTCPRCGAADQYGDNCEVCGATYAPTDLKDAYSVVSGARPELRESVHYFFDLPKAGDFLHKYIRESGVIQSEMSNKLEEWFTQGLKPWDISRDAPYFGFRIPDTEDKYFYVWLDAPVGYLASFRNYCAGRSIDYDSFVRQDSPHLMYHFIGKDILYFHSLFWPATLMAAGMRLPSRIFVHGYVTVNGAKMSKSKGTFIKAATFLKHQPPENLRYYFASKLNAQAVDVDLSLPDYMAKINSDIVGKVVNLASRTAGFISRRFDGMLAEAPADAALMASVPQVLEKVDRCYETLNYAEAVRLIMELADSANRYIAARQPWALAKDPEKTQELHQVCTDGINLFRALVAMLGPVMPALREKAQAFLNDDVAFLSAGAPLYSRRINAFTQMYSRVEQKDIDAMIEESKEDLRAAAKTAVPAGADAAAGTEYEPLAGEISIDDFAKVDLRVATVLSAEDIPEAGKLLRLKVDLGFEQREILAGIKKAYPDPSVLVGKKVVVVANLKPRKMKFGVSSGMVTAAGAGGSEIFLLSPDTGAKAGDRVH